MQTHHDFSGEALYTKIAFLRNWKGEGKPGKGGIIKYSISE